MSGEPLPGLWISVYCAAAMSEWTEYGLACPVHSGSAGGNAISCLAMLKTLGEKRKLAVINQSSMLRAGGSPDRRAGG